VKFERTEPFSADYARLGPRERETFRAAVREINEAYAHRTGWPPEWPAHLRIRQLRAHPGVWEMTWAFLGPDGRATFEFIQIGGEPAIRWRRIGSHRIFQNS
jgi:hypothetical protein